MHLTGGFLFTLFAALLHPFFISMTDINFNGADKELEISVRIFTDDFESVLRKNHPNVTIDLLHPADKDGMNGFVEDYVAKNINIAVNGTEEKMSFTGYEQQQESIWVYFEIKDIATVQKLTVANTLLYDFSTDQSNIIHVKGSDKEQTTKLNYPDKSTTFSF